MIAYLVLPTVRGGSAKTALYKGPPYKVYAISSIEDNFVPDKSDPGKLINRGRIGKPPYYRVSGVEGKDLVLEQLAKGSIDYLRVEKWVGNGSLGTRRIFNNSKASGIFLLQEGVVRIVTGQYIPRMNPFKRHLEK